MEFELTVGLEVHAELKTKHKIFCDCKNTFGKERNSVCCPICTGMPGTLPHFNREVIALALKAGHALNCKINKISTFDRKNYFYPDLPKGYQITQKEIPVLQDGYIYVCDEKINIERIHIEEDAGKLSYDENGNYIVDYNRCGIPLIEIVSKPDIHTAKVAVEYLKKLRLILIYAGVSDCKMQEGSMRCDVNVSVKPKGSKIIPERTEIKNVSSFKFIEKAIDYEYKRQIDIINQGLPVERLTLKIDEATGKTVPMRKKESADDYRYFPEPDLKKLIITDEEIREAQTCNFINPDELLNKYINRFNIPYKNALDIINKPEFCEFFESAIPITKNPNGVANLITSELFRYDIIKIMPAQIAELADLLFDNKINNATAKKVVGMIKNPNDSPKIIIEEQNLFQINDIDTIKEYVISSMKKHPKACEDFKNGNKSSIGPILGEINKLSNGLINQKIASEILNKQLLK